MIPMNKLTQILTGKRSISDVWHYILGNYRYKLYYSTKENIRRLMRTHIREQIDFRIKMMDSQCYYDGSCKLCGCETTALQMANKSCDKPCYPKMISKTKWIHFNQRGRSLLYEHERIWMSSIDIETGKKSFELYELNGKKYVLKETV
jgi:hypothetical protein